MAEPHGGGEPQRNRVGSILRAGAKAVGFAWGALATAVTIAVGVRDLLGADTDGWAKILAFAVGITMVVLAAALVWQVALGNDRAQISADRRVDDARRGFERTSRVSASTTLLHDALHDLRDYAYAARTADPEHLRSMLRESLEAQASMWSAITGAPCRVCLKEAVLTSDAPDAVDLGSIDPRHVVIRTYLRHTTTDLGTIHDDPTSLLRNTDFLSLFEDHKNRRWFCSNDLDKEINYGNPHREHSIDYNSTAIWPIQKRVGDKIDIWGFLCVDSLTTDIFDPQADFGLGAAVADTLYTSLLLPTFVRERNGASAQPITPGPSGSQPMRTQDPDTGDNA